MEKLYAKIKFPSGAKRYTPIFHAKHGARVFKTATEAQAHALKLRERLRRLKAAEAKANGAGDKIDNT